MIKEFWKERKEEKARQKAEKKKNKIKYRTKEERAYKVFGVLFTIFMIVASIIIAFKSCEGIGDYDWNSIIGITDEMIEALEKPVYESQVVTDKIDAIDWSESRDKMIAAGLELFVDNSLDQDLYENSTQVLDRSFDLKDDEVGALINEIDSMRGLTSAKRLLQFEIFQDGEIYCLKTIMILDLKSVVISNNLPKVYMTTTSTIRVLNNKIASLNPEYQINVIEQKLNEDIVEILEENALLGLHSLTNDSVVSVVNGFISKINCGIEISSGGLRFVAKG